MIEVVSGGLQTIVVDWPGRIGYWELAIPPSGPMDSLAFRLGNLLVGNAPGAAGLEIQFLGPELVFHGDCAVALTGAATDVALDGGAFPMWRSVPVRAGQRLRIGSCLDAARAYLCLSGGIDVPPFLGSFSTFLKGRVGGYEGRELKGGDRLQLKPRNERWIEDRRIREDHIPRYAEQRTIEVVLGPHDDWLDEAGVASFLGSAWEVLPASDRTGYRIKGPDLTFSRKAYDKLPENGEHPSNIIDFGYSVGSFNLSGQTPIILPVDGPSLGGFICPFTACQAAMWKIGQARPGDKLRMRSVTLDEADALTPALNAWASSTSLEPASAPAP